MGLFAGLRRLGRGTRRGLPVVAHLAAKDVAVEGRERLVEDADEGTSGKIARPGLLPGHDVEDLGQLAVADDLAALEVGAVRGRFAGGDGDRRRRGSGTFLGRRGAAEEQRGGGGDETDRGDSIGLHGFSWRLTVIGAGLRFLRSATHFVTVASPFGDRAR